MFKKVLSCIGAVAIAVSCIACTPSVAAQAATPGGGVDYMSEMVKAAQEATPYALRVGAIFERLRNEKIDNLGLAYEKTDFFQSGRTAGEIAEQLENYLNPPPPAPKYTEEEIDWITRVVNQEAGCDWMPDWVPQYVCSVIINRIESPLFPDTAKGVISQPGQYGPYITGSMWREPTARIKRIVKETLEHGSYLPAGVLGQSGYPTGAVHTSYYDNVLGTTIYFFYL